MEDKADKIVHVMLKSSYNIEIIIHICVLTTVAVTVPVAHGAPNQTMSGWQHWNLDRHSQDPPVQLQLEQRRGEKERERKNISVVGDCCHSSRTK